MKSYSTENKKLFWTNKKFVFVFDCSNWEKFEEKIWENQEDSLFGGLIPWACYSIRNNDSMFGGIVLYYSFSPKIKSYCVLKSNLYLRIPELQPEVAAIKILDKTGQNKSEI